MKSWKTTVAGIVAILATAAQALPEQHAHIRAIALIVAGIGAGLGLVFARDNSVTSEQAGASPDAKALKALLDGGSPVTVRDALRYKSGLVYECQPSKQHPDEYVVEAIDRASEGEIYAAEFSGPGAKLRAEEYTAWKNKMPS